MAATLLDILIVISLGLLAGTGTGLVIGFMARRQAREWAMMEKRDIVMNILLVAACSAVYIAALSWYLYVYSAR